jgi:3-oxoadipate enol-lactonase
MSGGLGVGRPPREALEQRPLEQRARLNFALGGAEHPPVLVLAGSLGTTMAMWDDQLVPLGEHRRVLRYDHRGHGASEVPPGPYRLEQLGQDVLGLLDDLRLQRVSFCGLSLGGMVGIWVASHAPDRVDRLALCCTSARVDPGVYLERAAKVRLGGTGSVVQEVVGRWFTPTFRAQAPERVARAVSMLIATPDEGYAGCCEAIAAMDLRPNLPAIAAPTLVVAALDDRAIPPPHADVIVAGIGRHAHRELVADAAHLAVVEQPERITDLLLEHLAG